MYFHRFSSSDYWFNQMYYGTHGPFKRAEGGQAITFENDKVHFHCENYQVSYFPLQNFNYKGFEVWSSWSSSAVPGWQSCRNCVSAFRIIRTIASTPACHQCQYTINNIICAIICTPVKHRVTTISTPLGGHHNHTIIHRKMTRCTTR